MMRIVVRFGGGAADSSSNRCRGCSPHHPTEAAGFGLSMQMSDKRRLRKQGPITYIDLDAMVAEATWFRPKPDQLFGAEPLMPEMMVPQTLEDYLAGRDSAVESVLRMKNLY